MQLSPPDWPHRRAAAAGHTGAVAAAAADGAGAAEGAAAVASCSSSSASSSLKMLDKVVGRKHRCHRRMPTVACCRRPLCSVRFDSSHRSRRPPRNRTPIHRRTRNRVSMVLPPLGQPNQPGQPLGQTVASNTFQPIRSIPCSGAYSTNSNCPNRNHRHFRPQNCYTYRTHRSLEFAGALRCSCPTVVAEELPNLGMRWPLQPMLHNLRSLAEVAMHPNPDSPASCSTAY